MGPKRLQTVKDDDEVKFNVLASLNIHVYCRVPTTQKIGKLQLRGGRGVILEKHTGIGEFVYMEKTSYFIFK